MPLRLRTFGSVYLSNDGDILSGAAAQRRLLAILTVLSVAGERGISRDKLLALLWSEGEPEKARHALTQSLYHIRKALGVGQVFLSGTDLRLNSGVIESDVADFQLALQQGRLADAVEVYGGAFLDGFYLTGNPEFDFWVSAERDRFTRQYADSLRTLAESARVAGRRDEQLRWSTALADHDPLDGAATAQLMACLIAGGDHAGALQRARVHEARMRAELDLPPDKVVVDLVSGLRRERRSPASGTSIAPVDVKDEAVVSPALPVGEEQRDVPAVRSPDGSSKLASTPASDDTRKFSSTSARRAHSWRRPDRLVAVAAAVLAAAVLGRVGWSARADGRAAERAMTIMVAPFHVASNDPSTAYLREGLMDLLTTRVAEVNTKRAADPASVLRVWRAAGYDTDTTISTAHIARVARELNAGQVVVGSMAGSEDGVLVRASLLDAATGKELGHADVAGSPDSLSALTDRIVSALIMTSSGRELAGTAPAGHISPDGLRAYLAGRSAYRRADYYSAVHADEQALAHDPNFALAAFNLAVAADRANVAQQHDRGLAIAWANQASLDPVDRAYLRAFAGPHYPEPSSASEVLGAWEEAVHVAPDKADGWYELGESFYYDGDLLGIHDAPARADAAFRQALKLDPSFEPARRMLTLLLARQMDTTRLRRLLSARSLDTSDAMSIFVRWRAANALHDERELARVRRAFDDAPKGALRAIAMTGQFDGVAIEDGDRALEILRRRQLTYAEQLDVDLARHSRALNAGDYDRALAITTEIGARQPALHAQLRLRVLDALYSVGNRDSARVAAGMLSGSAMNDARISAADNAVRIADACVAAQWQLSVHDTAAARASLRLLRSGRISRFPVPVGASPVACAELIDASLAIAERGAAARDRLAHLDSLMLSGPTVNDAMRYANLVVAREYQSIGDLPHAAAALQRRSYMRGWPRYRATGLLLLADISRQLGDTATARSAIERVTATRDRPVASPRATGTPRMFRRLRSLSRRLVH